MAGGKFLSKEFCFEILHSTQSGAEKLSAEHHEAETEHVSTEKKINCQVLRALARSFSAARRKGEIG